MKAAYSFTSFLIRNEVLKEEEKELYQYCFDLLFSVGISVCSILSVAVISGKLVETLFYLVGFWPLRMLAGGYHAKTSLYCLGLTLATYVAFLVSFEWGLYTQPYIISLILLGAIGIVFAFAPVGSKNKPLCVQKQIQLRRKSRWWVLALTVILFIRFIFPMVHGYCYSVAVGIAVASMSLLSAKILK